VLVIPREQSSCFYVVLRYLAESALRIEQQKNLTRIACS